MESLPRKEMRRRGTRGETRFLTCSCHEGQRLLQSRAIRLAIQSGLVDMVRCDVLAMHAWVIMGNHLHLLVTPRRESIEHALAVLKSSVARSMPTQANGAHQLWERGGGFDRLVWSERAYWNIFTYIHMNPVHAGLASIPEAWQWSSARDWMRQRRNTPTVQHPNWAEQ